MKPCLGKTRRLLARGFARQQASLFSRSGVRGLSPPAAGGIFLPSLKDKVQLFLERIQIPRGPGAGFGVAGFEHVPDELGVFVQGLAPVANGFEEGVHGFDEELFAVVGDKRQLRKR